MKGNEKSVARRWLGRAGMVSAMALVGLSAGTAEEPAHWVVSWGTSAAAAPDAEQIRARELAFSHQTLREIVHLSLGGSAIRVRFSNRFGSQELEIGAAHLALRAAHSSVEPSTDRALTFIGKPGTTVPPNAFVLSDPLTFAAPAGSDLAISIFVPHLTSAAAIHYLAQQTSYVGEGDQTGAPTISGARAITSWIFLGGVDVSAPPSAAAIAIFGDSRVDGDGSSPDANKRLSDALAKRLLQQGLPLGVLNAGIIGSISPGSNLSSSLTESSTLGCRAQSLPALEKP